MLNEKTVKQHVILETKNRLFAGKKENQPEKNILSSKKEGHMVVNITLLLRSFTFLSCKQRSRRRRIHDLQVRKNYNVTDAAKHVLVSLCLSHRQTELFLQNNLLVACNQCLSTVAAADKTVARSTFQIPCQRFSFFSLPLTELICVCQAG